MAPSAQEYLEAPDLQKVAPSLIDHAYAAGAPVLIYRFCIAA